MLKKWTLSILIISLTLSLNYMAFAKWNLSREGDLDGYIRGVHFVNENIGWAVGDGGIVLFTNNGGAKWEQKVLEEVKSGDLYTDLWDVWFVDEKNGWICGDLYKGTGVILYTKDGGKRWDRQNSGVPSQLFGIFFLDKNNGWAVGSNGTILATQNAGLKWTTLTVGRAGTEIGAGEPGIWDIQFVTLQKGWAVGENGTIRMTTDGGKTWVNQNSGTDSNISAVCFVNENVGWAVGEAGLILNTTDGGNTWKTQNSGLEDWLYSVSFVSEKEGIVVGEYGTVLRTSDGGNTWNLELSGKQKGGSKSAFRGASFPKPQTAYVAGDWGIIMKYTP
ncbi:MAG: WD40/YVTN/BNR-like repeat-containing protein [bacterium]